MTRYYATADWAIDPDADFLKGRYSRGHTLEFGSGVRVAGAASHQVVGNRWALAGAVDPEEMLVGAIAACHMLSFLHVAREAGFVVTRYRDAAVGVMSERADGEMWISEVTLRPDVAYRGERPGRAEAKDLHHSAHRLCYIANSVRTDIRVEHAPDGEAARTA